MKIVTLLALIPIMATGTGKSFVLHVQCFMFCFIYCTLFIFLKSDGQLHLQTRWKMLHSDRENDAAAICTEIL